MVALLFKGIKGVSFSCASSSSVAIRESIDRAKSIALPNTGRGSTRPKSQCTASKPMPTDGSVSPSSSSRYLLSSTALLSDDPSFLSSRGDEEEFFSKPPISSARPHDQQVVVLRVSLHCKGCEGKVRKHISKMEGVTSFSVDLATKKVTVMGDVTPSGVLDSISKVKNARFWSSPPRSSASSQLKEPY
ncbi:protein SODIUM POTASSIUM ROOT DEFECTIVE 2-like [Musa acuminata AAA Group]|uniref:protein SODIUM POTASSIUM ROOT DEFECTIVE 2-like n=1 Tax=Musa acuminata AAA Group TaxID=214697 RepID=UPI0031D77F65